MKLAVMQPYFFPYLGYFSLIKQTDKFVLFDPVQFIRHGWIERNRILKPAEGWQYVAVPLEKKGLGTLIRDVEIKQTEDWRNKIMRQLDHYKKRSPFYRAAAAVIEEALSIQTSSITHLNQHILKSVCAYLEIELDIAIFSEMALEIGEVSHPGEWALQISKAMRADEYVNPTGGIEIFNPAQFDSAGIRLTFLGNNLAPYSQRRDVFENGLSIIDVMMFNDVAAINRLIDDTRTVDLPAGQ